MHPLVAEVLAEIDRQRYKAAALERAAGVGSKTIRSWRRRHMPLVHNLEAVGHCLGLTLRWVPAIEERGEANAAMVSRPKL
jgi:hypothetical protein